MAASKRITFAKEIGKPQFGSMWKGFLKCVWCYPYLELFWSIFSCIWTEYGDIQSECGKMQTRIIPDMENFFTVTVRLESNALLSK